VVEGVAKEYPADVAVIVRHFPVGERIRAFDASLAAEAAGAQGRFWEMYERIFQGQPDWSTSDDHRSYFDRDAAEIGLDLPRFKADMDSEAAKSRIGADIARGRSAGVAKTPSLFLNGRPVPFSQITVEDLTTLINQQLTALPR
jgi:protein-disulfide isomerase